MKLSTPILLLVVAVLLPTACVLWLINAAMRNVRLNVGQTLANVDADRLNVTRDFLNAAWQERTAALERLPPGAAAIPEIVRAGLADSAVILDSSGAPLYPAPMPLPGPDPTAADPQWVKARLLEATTPSAAVAAYQAIGAAAADTSVKARACQAAARSLLEAGDKESAIRLVLDRFSGTAMDKATDLQGRRIRADALLLAASSLKPGDPRLLPTAGLLRSALLDYSGNPAMPSAQRIFLIRQMQSMKLPTQLLDFPALEAEEMAARFLEAEPRPAGAGAGDRASPFVGDASLRLSPLPDVWQVSAGKAHVVALLRTSTVEEQIRRTLAEQKLPSGVRIVVLPPGSPEIPGGVVQTTAGPRLPGWGIALTHTGANPLDDLAARSMALYLWAGSLVLAAVMIVALLAGRAVARSLRLASMKADLVATVSHELKTPLASMQLLVDTLLEDAQLDPLKTREYLEMMARENSRLSRLIGNFLAFSRMERNKYSFDFTAVRVDDVIRAAVSAAGERFSEPGCRLTVEVEPNLPEIRADESALVTALVNLLDNAYKYTPGEKHIELRGSCPAAWRLF